MATGMGVVAMMCCVASAQMGDMPTMHHHHDEGEKLGSVSFPVSCDARFEGADGARDCAAALVWIRGGGRAV